MHPCRFCQIKNVVVVCQPCRANDRSLAVFSCVSRCLLASWCQRHGIAVQRLGLPKQGMPNDNDAKKLIDEVFDSTMRGLQSFVWIALMSTQWCQGQVLKLHIRPPVTPTNIEKECTTSLKLMEFLLELVRQIRSNSVAENLVHPAFKLVRRSL